MFNIIRQYHKMNIYVKISTISLVYLLMFNENMRHFKEKLVFLVKK